MARLPQLPAPMEFRILRTACALSPRTQRLLFGRPPVVDGQELAPEIHVLMRLVTLAERPSLTGGLPPEEARTYVLSDVAATSGPQTPMAEVRELEIPGPTGPLAARLYVPHSAPPAPAPLLVFFHGGGWVVGSLETHDEPCRFLAAHAGIRVLSCSYRLAPEAIFPAAVEDAHAAFRWALEQADELGADELRVAIGGDSAGGNMAAGICLLQREAGESQPAMQLLIYPVTDAFGGQRSRELFGKGFRLTMEDIDYFKGHYLPDESQGRDPRASVLRVEDLSRLPPAYVVTAGFDPLRDEGEEYALRMREAGVRVALRRHPGLTHLFINMTAFSRSARAAMHEIAGALRMGLA